MFSSDKVTHFMAGGVVNGTAFMLLNGKYSQTKKPDILLPWVLGVLSGFVVEGVQVIEGKPFDFPDALMTALGSTSAMGIEVFSW